MNIELAVEEKEKIRSFQDLEVYQRAYKASIQVMTQIITRLPAIEKYDLKDQLSRSSKAIPRLIAEGYAKKHQKKDFRNILMMQWLNQMKLKWAFAKFVTCTLHT